MNKFRLTIIILLLLPAFIKAQTRVYYKYYDIQGIGALSSHAKIISSSDNKFYYMAFAEYDTNSVGGGFFTSLIYSKLTDSGTIVWTKEIIDSPYASYHNVSACSMPNDQFLVSFNRRAGVDSEISNSTVVLEVDTNGNVIYNYSNSVQGQSEYESVFMDDGYPYLASSDFNNDAFAITKFDLKLNPIWTKEFNFGKYSVSFQYGMPTADHNLVLAGQSDYDVGMVVLDCDENGNMNWSKAYTCYYNDSSSSLYLSINSGLEDYSHNILFVGSNGTEDAAIVKIDSLGNPLFCDLFGGDSFDEAYDILPSGNSHYMVVAEPESFTTPYHSMASLARFDLAGNLDWMKIYGNTSVGSFPYDGLQNPDSTYTMFGINGVFGEAKDIFLMKLSSTGYAACESEDVYPHNIPYQFTTTDLNPAMSSYSYDSSEAFNPKTLSINTFVICDSIADTAKSISVYVNSATVCSGYPATLIATGAQNYTWSPSAGLSATTGDTVTAVPTVTTTYTVIGTGNGLSDTVKAIVTIIPAPNLPTITVKGDTLISSATHYNQWFRNDSILVGDTSRFLIIGKNKGWYFVEVTNPANGCSTNSDSTTSINQLSVISNQLSIYPNPFGHIIFIKIKSFVSSLSEWNLQITDVLGQQVYEATSLNYLNKVDMSNWPDAMYFISITNGNDRAVFKVVKQE